MHYTTEDMVEGWRNLLLTTLMNIDEQIPNDALGNA